MKKGIIFDMDGTLWDSAAGVAESWNEAILAYGYERKPLTAGDIQSVMGKTMEDIADILFPELNVMQRKELLDLCCRLRMIISAGMAECFIRTSAKQWKS